MKKLLTVFQFEWMSYVKNKSFMITTIVTALLLFGVTFLPRFINMSDVLGITQDTEQQRDEEDKTGDDDPAKLGMVDAGGYFADPSLLEQAFPDAEFIYMDTEQELKDAVSEEKIEAGFYVVDDRNYRYYILDRDMEDENRRVFDEVMTVIHKQVYCAENGLQYEVMAAGYEAPVHCEEEILGKDAADNFWYC